MIIFRKCKRALCPVCAAILLVAALSLSAFAAGGADAASAEAQMAANSAAWYIAYAAGDTATCEALHAANVALADQLASGGGSSSYDAGTGAWNISTAAGDTVSSSTSSNGKQTTNTYTTTTSSGYISSASADTYSDSSIDAYKSNGGTNEGLQTAYNNDAYGVSSTYSFGDTNAVNSAAAEAAVAKELLGLSDAEAAKLQSDLEQAKQAYTSAWNAYQAALASGDSAAIAAAEAQTQKAHDAAQAIRAEYSYTGDAQEYYDGGYYHGDRQPQGYSGGGFFYTDISETFRITASAGPGGSVDPAGEVTVRKGDSRTFVFTPDTGYGIRSVTVDGEDRGAVPSYTFSNVSSTHTVTAEFEKLKFTIRASAGPGGRISPSGDSSVEYGGMKTFRILPDEGFRIRDVRVDGVSEGTPANYTFFHVTEAHTISAEFERVPGGTVNIDSVRLTDALGTDLNGKSIKSGYGIYARVSASWTGASGVRAVMNYDFGSGSRTVMLEQESFVSSGLYGDFCFPRNYASPTQQRCVYIPVETPDGTYDLTVTVTAAGNDGKSITASKTVRLTVLGSMYEDDFTGDS